MRSTVRIVAGGLAFATAAVLCFSGPAAAAPAYPAAAGRCVDEVGVLGPDVCARVTEFLLADERATTDEIAVAVVPTTGDATIEAWSTGLFNTWGVGKKSKNNGVLLVVAVDDRRVRLATGTGLAKRLDDRAAAQIVDKTITPRFAEDAYAAGILTGLDEVRHRLGHTTAGRQLAPLAQPAAEPAPGPVAEPVSGGIPDISGDDTDLGFSSDVTDEEPGLPLGLFLIVGLALVGIIGFAARITGSGGSRVRADGHTSHWHSTSSSHSSTDWSSSSGGSSSSSSDFGGGSSSGGGASGSW
jgi:uncharacterized protein